MRDMKIKNNKLSSLLIVLILIAFLLPFFIMLLGSIKPNLAFSIVPIDLSPVSNLTLDNYSSVFGIVNFVRAFRNSVIILIIVVAAEVLMGITTGYVFATKQFPLKRVLFALVIVTMMLPKQLLLVPNFMVAKKLSLVDSLMGVAVTTINASYGIFLSRQYILTIPKDLFDSAMIDGCGDWLLFWRIAFPLLKPVMAAIAITSMFSAWNDYLWQNVMLSSTSNQTIPLMLAYLANRTSNNNPSIGIQLAGSTMSVLPLLTFFLFFQRWFIEGIAMGGVKE